jgi:glycosyltransferase involved in cell wall biosynthesis
MDVEGGRKRVDRLIEIFRELDGPNAGLVIVGSGMRDEWKARMNPRTTMYLGEIHDPENRQISRVFRMADLCVIPGHVGLSLNQAFYFGLPVVTETGSHPPEINYLKPGRNGCIVPENDLMAMKACISRLLEDDGLRAELSRNARNDILAEAPTEGMFRGFLGCLSFMTGGMPTH